MTTLQQYIIALTNLFGMVGKSKVMKIYNQQNEEQLSITDIEDFCEANEEALIEQFVYPIPGFFAHQAIMFTDSVDEMVEEQLGKPYYIPEKEELLQYVDGNYFEKTKEYNDLLKFIESHFVEDPDAAEELCREIHGLKQMQVNTQEVFNTLDRNNISFENDEQLNEFFMKVSLMANNTRIWENNGFTPNEIFEKYEKPNLRPLPKRPFKMNKKEKPKRNDPCHCGSGKKYKKCCLRKDEAEKYN
jgi:preprotein translocase subunit SecA